MFTEPEPSLDDVEDKSVENGEPGRTTEIEANSVSFASPSDFGDGEESSLEVGDAGSRAEAEVVLRLSSSLRPSSRIEICFLSELPPVWASTNRSEHFFLHFNHTKYCTRVE
mmetsp:Transcript_9670/g.15875  ORF Transcript_9670/g.15875 Transcript_9670/m.15875 type:complete len:112 (-) Transcript_9670:1001-1336(-)